MTLENYVEMLYGDTTDASSRKDDDMSLNSCIMSLIMIEPHVPLNPKPETLACILRLPGVFVPDSGRGIAKLLGNPNKPQH